MIFNPQSQSTHLLQNFIHLLSLWLYPKRYL